MTVPSFADQISATGISQRSGFHVRPDFTPPKGAALALQAALVFFIAIQIAAAAVVYLSLQFTQRVLDGEYFDEEAFYADTESLQRFANMLPVAAICAFVLCVLTYCIFVYRAASNIQEANAKGHDHSPGWSVGLGFIPIAQLFFIFIVMRGIWRASHDPKNGLYATSILIPLWWILYVVGSVAGNFISRETDRVVASGDMDSYTTLSWLVISGAAILALSCVFLILIVRSITRAQSNWPALDKGSASQSPA